MKSRFVHSAEYTLFLNCLQTPPPENMDSIPIPEPDTVPSTPCTISASNDSPISTPLPSAPKQGKEKRTKIPKTPSSYERHTPFTTPWVAARLKDSPGRAISILRNWSHSKCYRKVTEQTIEEINKLNTENALKALNQLKEPHVFVRGTKGSKLAITANIITLDTKAEHKAHALIDSGCEGSCIDVKYVKRLGLNTTKLPRAIPVYNADGTLNLDGSITDMISLELRIRDHVEHIDFGVTNLGKGEIFLGHDWLKIHNPSINWRDGTIEFNRCPSLCRPFDLLFTELDSEDQDSKTPQWDKDDKILMVDPTPALQIRARTNIATELAIKEYNKTTPKPWKDNVPEYLHDFPDVFEKNDFDKLPPHRP